MPSYREHLAIDPATARPVAGTVFEVWTPGQVGVPGAQLAVTDLAGVPIASLVSTSLGVLPPFATGDQPVVVVTSGTYQTVLVSAEYLVDQARTAAASSADSAAGARASASAADQLAAASGIPPGGAVGQALVRAAGGATTWAAPDMTAAGVAFAPTGTITATSVQEAVAQAAQQGGTGASAGQILVVQHTTAGYTVPTARPDGVQMVWFRGPVQPLWDVLPAWLADVDAVYDWRAGA